MSTRMPKYRFRRLADITADDLRRMGALGVGLDVDNTTAFDSSNELIEGVAEWVGKSARRVPDGAHFQRI